MKFNYILTLLKLKFSKKDGIVKKSIFRKELVFVHVETFLENIRNQDIKLGNFLFHEKRKQLSFRMLNNKTGDVFVKFFEVNLLDFVIPKDDDKVWNLKDFDVKPFSDDRLVVEATLKAQANEKKIGFVASRWHYSLKK